MSDFNIKHAIKQSNLIEEVDDAQAEADSLRAWKYLKDFDYLTFDNIKTAHWLIAENLLPQDERGTYRSENATNVTVGGRMCPAHYMVQELMYNWVEQARFMEPKEAHIAFEKIHPFVDGNGRIGRLIYYWMGAEEVIEYKDRQEYYGWFK